MVSPWILEPTMGTLLPLASKRRSTIDPETNGSVQVVGLMSPHACGALARIKNRPTARRRTLLTRFTNFGAAVADIVTPPFNEERSWLRLFESVQVPIS